MNISFVILHGWGASARSYDKLKPLLEQKGISVFVFDLPGFGNEPVPTSAWSIDDYVEWTREKIEKIVKIPPTPLLQKGEDEGEILQKEREEGKIMLFGHSFGGRIAIKFAAKYPEKLSGLILCDAAGTTPRPKAQLNLFRIISRAGNAIFSLPLLNYLKPVARRFIYVFAGAKDYSRLQNPVMKNIFKKIIEEDLVLYLNKIKTPALIVWGENDRETPASDAYTMNEKITGSKLEILENTGHSPHLECPEKLAEIIRSFINRL